METFLKIARSIFLLMLASVGALAGYIFFFESAANSGTTDSSADYEVVSTQQGDADVKEVAPAEEKVAPAATVEKEKLAVRDVRNSVPFISQAPTGNWDEQIFQDGCEEASIIMALAWARSQSLDPRRAEQEIRDLSAYEIKTHGFAVDISAKDAVELMRAYYAFNKAQLKTDIDIEDIKQELLQGNIVIIPAHGRTLANPHYTSPGPVAHMLVVTGYDSAKREFITNDPGTRFGGDYRYSEQTLGEALWDYPTSGEHAVFPGIGKTKKDMIVVGKN